MFSSRFLFIILLLLPALGFPCDCVLKNIINPTREIQKAARENSECILVGRIKIIDVKKQIFEVTVIESLDGSDVQDNVYLGKGWKYCEPYVINDSVWIIYGKTEEGYLRPNICGISRSFDMFKQKKLDMDSVEHGSAVSEIRKDFLNSLGLEINALRQEKRKRLTQNQKSNF